MLETDLGIEGVDALSGTFKHALHEGAVAVSLHHLLNVLGPALLRGGPKLSQPGPVEGVGWAAGPARPDFDVTAACNEAQWRAIRFEKPDAVAGLVGRRQQWPVWSAEVQEAVTRSLAIAAREGVPHARGIHLAAAVLTSPGFAGSEQLTFDIGALRELASDTRSLQTPGTPYRTVVGVLEAGGVVKPRQQSSALRGLSRLIFGLVAKSAANGSPVLRYCEPETVRQCVRAGDTTVSAAHLVLAILSIEEQISAAELSFVPKVAAYNKAGEILRRKGARLNAALAASREAAVPQTPLSREENLRFFDGDNVADPLWGREAASSLEAAIQLAEKLGHPGAGTNHVLMASLDGSESAIALMRRLNVDVEELRSALSA